MLDPLTLFTTQTVNKVRSLEVPAIHSGSPNADTVHKILLDVRETRT